MYESVYFVIIIIIIYLHTKRMTRTREQWTQQVMRLTESEPDWSTAEYRLATARRLADAELTSVVDRHWGAERAATKINTVRIVAPLPVLPTRLRRPPQL